MKARRILISVLVPSILLLAAAVGLTYAQGPEPPNSPVPRGTLGTAFTYQGQLKAGGEPVKDACEMAFRLYDDATAGSQVGTAITATVAISDGLFTQPLDFGNAFTGDARWLDIRVQCPGDSVFTDLGRQPLAAAPYAQHASSTGALHGQPVTTTVPSAGQVLEWDGAAWGPALDDDTIYSAGFGLTLVGTTFNVLTDTVQSRVTGECTTGSMVSAVNADGTVVCEPHDTRPVFNQMTLDTDGNVGRFASITIGADGLPIIIYTDRTNWSLKVAHCNDTACTSATLTTLDTAGNIGSYNSIAIGADGLPIISYYDATSDDLKVAHCNDIACASATLSTLDTTNNVGRFTSIAIGVDGLPIISYHDDTNSDLKVAHCDNITCTSASITVPDSNDDVGDFPSITIGSDGLPIISHCDTTNGYLKVARCNDTACTSSANVIVDTISIPSEYASVASIAIGTDGMPIISYYDAISDDLRVTHCSNTFCVPYWRRR